MLMFLNENKEVGKIDNAIYLLRCGKKNKKSKNGLRMK